MPESKTPIARASIARLYEAPTRTRVSRYNSPSKFASEQKHARDITKEGAMRRSIRLTVLGCAAALALACAAMAAASYTPSMGIFQQSYAPGGSKPVTIVVAQETADDPTARIVIYAPPGYTATLTQAVGTTIGSVVAHVQVLDLGPNALPLTGPVKADSPANYPAASNLCTPGVTHEAVWTLNAALRSEEHTSELQSLRTISYAVFCLKKKKY